LVAKQDVLIGIKKMVFSFFKK